MLSQLSTCICRPTTGVAIRIGSFKMKMAVQTNDSVILESTGVYLAVCPPGRRNRTSKTESRIKSWNVVHVNYSLMAHNNRYKTLNVTNWHTDEQTTQPFGTPASCESEPHQTSNGDILEDFEYVLAARKRFGIRRTVSPIGAFFGGGTTALIQTTQLRNPWGNAPNLNRWTVVKLSAITENFVKIVQRILPCERLHSQIRLKNWQKFYFLDWNLKIDPDKSNQCWR